MKSCTVLIGLPSAANITLIIRWLEAFSQLNKVKTEILAVGAEAKEAAGL